MTIYWKAVEQYFTVVPFVFQFYPVCHFEKIIYFVKGERVKPQKDITSFSENQSLKRTLPPTFTVFGLISSILFLSFSTKTPGLSCLKLG